MSNINKTSLISDDGSLLGAHGQEPVISSSAELDAHFVELMAHLKQVFWMNNAEDDAVIYVSPAYEKIWGRSRAALYDSSHNFLGSAHPEDATQLAEAIAEKSKNEGYDLEYRILRPDSSIRWVWARSYPVKNDLGEVQCYAGIAEDISERKWGDKERARLAAIIEHTDDSIVSTTLDGIIVAWNRGAERKYGYTAEEIMGHSISSLIPADHSQEYQNAVKKLKRGEPVPAYETVRRRKDGTLISLSVGLSPIEAREGEIVGVSKISREISQVKLLEAQLIEAQKMDVIGQLIGGVAHDFNNILTVVLGFSDLLIYQLRGEHALKSSVEAIRNAAIRGGGLTRQLLGFSRKEAVHAVVVNLNEELATLDTILRRLIDENVGLTITYGKEIGHVHIDPGYFGQVVMNLVVNARDAMPHGGALFISTSDVTVRGNETANPTAVKPGDYVVLNVRDTGSGMTDQVKARLFEPFFTTKPRGAGTGLGLATCQKIIQKSGGYIGLDSEVGKGTTFTIYFPRAVVSSNSVSPFVVPATIPHGTETLLVVEDDPGVRHLVGELLQNQGYKVLTASNGEDGLRTVTNHKGDAVKLVITDVIMPHMGGRALAVGLEKNDPAIKVLFTSGYTDEVVLLHGGLPPGFAFISKPYTLMMLARKVREVLDDR